MRMSILEYTLSLQYVYRDYSKVQASTSWYMDLRERDTGLENYPISKLFYSLEPWSN